MTAAEILADFTHDLSLPRLPDAVVANAKLRILDTVGIALAATTQDFAPSVLRAMKGLGQSPKVSTIIGTRSRVPAPVAALANGALAHGLDFDDTHTASITHASACVVPPALALGEARRLPGRELLVAAVAGWESITRLGVAAPNAFHARGFHATRVCGALDDLRRTVRTLPNPPWGRGVRHQSAEEGAWRGMGDPCHLLQTVPLLPLQPCLHRRRARSVAQTRDPGGRCGAD